MKTTVYWPEYVYEALRRLAFERRTSINKLVIEAVEARLGARHTPQRPRRARRS